MVLGNPHLRSDLLSYLEGTLEEREKHAVEAHLQTCTECRQNLDFVKDIRSGLAGLSEEEFASREPCPDSWTLVSYEAGEVDEETARHLRVHLLFCDDCAEEFHALRRSNRAISWLDLIEKLKESVVDLGKRYEIGVFIGSVKIMGEQLALARRGEARTETISKVFALAVGENNYSIELGIAPEGSLSCNIAGYKTPHWTPLMVSVCAETGEELFATETDEQGNTQFVLEREEVPREMCILVLTLGKSESYLPFRIPEAPTAS